MRKIFLFILIVVLILAVIPIVIYLNFYNPESNNAMVSIMGIVIESLLTGAVTFTGLIITFSFQRQHDKENYEKSVCPCVVVKTASDNNSSQKIDSSLVDKTELLVTNEKYVRGLKCNIFNPTSNYILNVKLVGIGEREFPLELKRNKTFKLYLANNNKNKLVFSFEDIFGNRYRQIIEYEKVENEDYTFHYTSPIKLKKEVSKKGIFKHGKN